MKITHQTGVRGTGNPTVGDLRMLVAELAEPRIPDDARVELYMRGFGKAIASVKGAR